MLTPEQIRQYEHDGYLVLPGVVPPAQVAALREQASVWAERLMPRHVEAGTASRPAVFSSVDRARTDDAALIASADQVHGFFEADAFGADGRLQHPPERSLNKIGHALHDLDPVFDAFSRKPALAALSADLGLVQPLIWQSQLIFKHAGVGGAVRWHQDATFLHTTPPSVTALWFALDDADRHNGALRVLPGGHRGPLRERFVREGDRLRMQPLDATPWPADDEGLALEVAAGGLVCLHGLLPHASGPNPSGRSRLAYVLHLTDARTPYSAGNWLQRGPALPVRGFSPPPAPATDEAAPGRPAASSAP